jgi:hypothetical protein
MLAIIQEFIYTTYTKRRRLLDCYVHQGVTSEGYGILLGLVATGHSRNVGITEMPRVATKELTTAICFSLYDYLSDHTGYAQLDDIAQFLSTSRSQDLPWFFLCEQLQASGRLKHVVSDLYARTGHVLPANVNDLYQVAPYLGRAASAIMEDWT